MNKIWPISKIIFRSLSEITETREVALVFSDPAWQAIEAKLGLPIVWKVEIREATESTWSQYLDNLKGDVVYVVGGLTADAAKYMASKHGCR